MTLEVVLVGGSGFLGTGLSKRLTDLGNSVTVIGRGPSGSRGAVKHIHWDGRTLGDWVAALDGADVVVHLAGKRVDCRPTRSSIDELISSREGTVRLVGQALERVDRPPSSWVQLSSLAIFGDGGDVVIDETTAPPTVGPRQQVEVCQRWEAAFHQASVGVERSVLLRPAIGIGGHADPATRQLSRLAKLGLAGPVGGGNQWVSWIGIDDLLDLLTQAVIDPSMSGLYHLASPTPVRNSELMAAYRHAVGRKFGLPAPRPFATVGAWLLGSDPELALTGRRCIPTRLLDEGHTFRNTNLNDIVAQAVHAAN